MRLSAICLAVPALACAQIQDLATTDDGAQTYFSATYRQKGTNQAGYLKIFRVAEDGLQLFRQLDESQGFYQAVLPSVSGDGRVVAYTAFLCPCIGTPNDEAVLAGSPDRSLGAGSIVVSPDGRSYMLLGYAFIGPQPITIVDSSADASTTLTGCNQIGDGRQSLANGGVALLTCGTPVLWKDGQKRPLTLNATPFNARLDAAADRIVYETGLELHSYSVASGTDLVLADLVLATGGVQPWMTSDGTQVSYILNNQLYVQSTSGGPARALTDASDGAIVDAVISGWGNVAFAANSFGRLFRIDVATGAKTELIAPVPHLQVTFGQPAPGGRIDVTVTGPQDGDPAITGLDAVAPIVGRSDNVVTFQIPWEAAVGSTVSLVVPGNQSAFEEVHDLQIVRGAPTFYSVAVHQDFSALVTDTSPAQPGEIVHVYATDLGAVAPPIATGAITPTGTLYTLQTPPTCSFFEKGNTYPANILFAGLAPEMIGVNQIDVMIPAQATAPTIELDCLIGQGTGAIFASTQLQITK